MKKNRLKNLLKCGILLFGISLSHTNCSNDDKIAIEEKSKFLKGITHQSFSSIKNISLVQEKTSRFIKSKNEFNRTSSDSIAFTIDTTSVQVIESQIYTSYTFRADMFNEVDSLLNNYVLTVYNDNSFNQMLVTYPIIGAIDDAYYDVDNAIAEPIDGDIILNARGGCDGYPVTSWVETCETYNCTLGAGCTGNNDGGSWTDPYEVCEGAWVHGCEQANSIDAPDGPSGGGGGTTTTPDDEDDAVAIVPFDNLTGRRIRRECNKISDLLTDNPEYKTKLLQLAADAPNSTFEKGIAIDKNNNEVIMPNGTAGKIDIPLNPTEEYLSIAHIQDAVGDQGNGTFSVPSLNDMSNLGYISVINNKVKLNKLVYFVFTADGTYYALTINNSTKFRNFWAYHKLLYSNSTSLTNEQRNEYLKILEDRAQQNNNGIYHKYYNDENGSLIDETSIDNEQQLKYFLQFLNEEDGMGVSVFEADAQLNQFTLVQLNDVNLNGEPQRDICN